MTSPPPAAVILLSGGLDSATALAIARAEGLRCHALSFDYGQRHRFELESARAIARSFSVAEHRIISIDLRAFGGSALTTDIPVPHSRAYIPAPPDQPQDQESPQGAPPTPLPGAGAEIPITYVPARNTIFLSFALAYAEVISAHDIFIGVNAIDYSGYPDCRPDFISAFENMANLATRMTIEGAKISIRTPLVNLTKAQIIKRGIELGVDYSLTHSCYDPDETGRPCGGCDSCLLRAAGFADAGIEDPALFGC